MAATTLLQDPRYPAFVARYHADFLRFAIEVCGMKPSQDQIDLLIAISAPRARVSVVSGTSTGKTAAFARIAVAHLLASPYAIYEGKVEVGSNTYIGGPKVQTVADGIWKEMQDTKLAILNGPHAWIGQYFTIGKTQVGVHGFESQWYIQQIAMAAGQSVGVAGRHRQHQLILVDEACGVPDGHFDVVNGTQTQSFNRTLLASQGARSSGFFYDTHHKLSNKHVTAQGERGAWLSLCFNSENSPFVDADWLSNRLLETGGRDTVEYMIRVLGMFPELTDKFLIGRTAIEAMVGARPAIEPDEPWGHVIVIDVAAGVFRDKTVVTHMKMCGTGDRLDPDPRRADVVDIPVFSNSLDWKQIIGQVIDYVNHNPHEGGLPLSNPTFVVDVGGQGEQFARQLEDKSGTTVIRSQWGNPPFKKKNLARFFNQRAQCHVHACEAVKDGRMTFIKKYSKELADEMGRLPFHFDERARYHIMPKDKMKELEGLPSPDLSDTICMAFLDNVHYIPADSGGGRRGDARKQAAADMFAQLNAMLEPAKPEPLALPAP